MTTAQLVAIANNIAYGTKRKASNTEDPFNVTEDCDTVRRKIRTFLMAGEMKIGESKKAIGVTHSNSYERFMGQRGPFQSSKNEMYPKAFAFFK